jgi:predicted SAM-dependent methyltransferase
VVDIGAGYCEFINNIRCGLKYAVDLNEDTQKFANSDVSVFRLKSSNLVKFHDTSVDVVFMSNFLEHLKNKDEVNATLSEINRILKKGGRLLIIQPNIKYTYKEYWDFYDHQIPFSHLSLSEALINHNFEIVESIPKFLPFTTKGRLPKSTFLLRVYLKVPLLHKLYGKQMFIIARKT